ncbi:MAG: Serine protease AprX [Anaerolineales bacterium]|nr:Serine protease AprX [Anaerolineales bacterium]
MFRFHKFRVVLLLVLASAIAGIPLAGAAPAPQSPTILLKARTIQPVPGLDQDTASDLLAAEAHAAAENGSFHALIQLDHIPSLAEKKALAAQGLHLQSYLPHQAWIARVDTVQSGPLHTLAGQKDVTWVGALLPTDKLDPSLVEYLAQPAEPDFGGEIAVSVQLHADVNLAAGRELLKRYDARITGEASAINLLTAELARADVTALSQEEEVLWLELPMPALTATNANSRTRTNVDNIQNTAPYNLNGSGITVLVFDVGRASHPDYNGRNVDQDSTNVADHSSHVAGTALGNGAGDPTNSVANNRGMAPSANLITYGLETDGTNLFLYDNTGDVQADFQSALDNGADIGTASLGTNLANNGTNRINNGNPVGVFQCNREGDYNTTSQLLDNIVRGSLGSPFIMTWAAGNERGDGRCGNQFNTTAPPANAKNPIHVAATNQNNDGSANFSSWGPTDDGRLKPIVSAPGVNVLSTIPNTFIDNRNRNCVNNPASPNDGDDYCWPYDTMSGTSMATPAVAGIVALMLEQFQDSYNTPNNLLPATVKALLMNTAADGDGADGPDFETGYGRVDAQAAVDAILENRFRDGSLTNTGDVDRYYIEVPAGAAALQVSLAWDDAAGNALAATELVNDLDLRLVEPGGATTWQPWVLDPTAGNEANNAARGDDTLNNQEQVMVQNPAAGWWTVEVRADSLPQGPQTYGLAATHNPWTFSLEHPTNAQPADAGYFAGPGKFLVRLDISDGYRPSTNITAMDPSTDLEMSVGSEQIGVDGGAIVHYGPVGNEYHLVVRAPAQAAAGAYDFTVNFQSAFTETETSAVVYQSTPVDPKAMSLVLDRSGSMGYDSKLDAAKNAGRDFIFMSEIDDGLAQVEFNENYNIFQNLTDVTAEADLTTFSNNLNPITADGWTGIGGAVKAGYDEIKADSRIPSLVLLSDGLQNRDPMWEDVRDDIPTNVKIHTVALGPDADQTLMAQIADRHDGDFHPVPTGAGTLLALNAITADVSVASRVENRLADVYQFIAGEVRDYERHRERAGTLNAGNSTTYDITIDESVPWVFFTLNWADTSASLTLKLRRPDGVTYVNASDADAVYRTDVTSERFRMTAPVPGTWRMEISNTGGVATEYLATAEGPADTDLMVFTPSLGECRPTKPERICAGFVDGKGYVDGDQTFLLLGIEGTQERQLSKTEHGYYCTTEELYFPEGGNSVKIEASGQDREGKAIHRIERKGFYCGDLDVPAVLLVNDVRAYQGEFYFPERDMYITALNDLGVDHDVWDTDIDGPPSASVLNRYQTVIWLTADDDVRETGIGSGRSTLDTDEESAVDAFLKYRKGNVFALSSQGYLDVYGLTLFAKDGLGVQGFNPGIGSTKIRGVRDTALGHEFGDYAFGPPYTNSNDELIPGPESDANFVDENDKVTGVTHAYGQGCAAFFAFGLEGLPAAQLKEAVKRIVEWDCAPVDVSVDASTTITDVTLNYGETYTDTFSIENPAPNIGGLRVELNNGPTHLWLLTDSAGGVPNLLASYNVGDLPTPLAATATASAPLNSANAVSRLCEITTGLSDCCTGGTCTEEMLLDNDVAIVWNNTPFADPAVLGNMLADFVDRGGTVLLGGDALVYGASGLKGRFASEGYSPLVSNGTILGAASLGTILTPGHPVLDGVGAISTSDHLDVSSTAGDVAVHAQWNDSEPLVATRVVRPGTGGQVIAINASFENGAWANNLDTLVANALGLLDESWRYPGWFDLDCSETPPAETGVPPMVFDGTLTCPDVQGGVNWQVGLRVDSSFAPASSINLATPPSYHGKITVDTNAMGRARVNMPLDMTVLCPIGDTDCDLAISIIDLQQIAAYFGDPSPPSWADVDDDGDVDVDDLMAIASNWRRTFQ